MNVQKLSKELVWVILIPLLLVGCGAAPPKPIPEVVDEPILVTFDGEGCYSSLPVALSTGEHSFVFVYTTEEGYALWTSRLLDGKTYQDVVALQSEPGEYILKPTWTEHPRRVGRAIWDESVGGYIKTWAFDEEGEYVLDTGNGSTASGPLSIWLCGSFQVVEAPSK